jgi:hypothetical protein
MGIKEEHKIEVEINDKNENRENQKPQSNTNQLQQRKMSSASTSSIIPENQIISASNPVSIATHARAPVPKPSKECRVCFDAYNKSTRARVTCQSCGFEACRQCHSTFILDASNTLPNCMECHKEFQREFLVDSFTLKFVSKDWKEHRERVMLQKERALLPTRQPVAEMVKRKNDLNVQCNAILEQINALRSQHYACSTEKNRLEHRIRVGPAADASLPASQREHAAFVRPCPNTAANCRGFLSTQWKCNLCSMWTCKDCHEMKGDAQDTPHVCNADNLASAKLIDAETRACPKCGARVYKISGCNQMFCTACNDCAFDWVTGRVETVIHNPHYYEFQRQLNGGQAPRVPGDILCGREIDHMTTTVVTNLFPAESISRNIIVWRNLHKDFVNERHVPTIAAGAVGAAGAAAANTAPTIPISAKDKWDRFYSDCILNVNNMMEDPMDNKKQQSPSTTSQQQQQQQKANQNLCPIPAMDISRLRERMIIERMILFRKLQLQEVCRIIIEIRHVLLPQYRVDPLRYNEELGVKYLLGELTEQEFAVALQRSDKRMQKSRDIQNILTMVLTTSTDIIFRFADHLRQSNANKRPYQEVTRKDFEIMDEIRELFKYANRCMNVVARTYQSKVTLTIGQTLEPKYWEDDGALMYAKMTEYNRAIGVAAAVANFNVNRAYGYR